MRIKVENGKKVEMEVVFTGYYNCGGNNGYNKIVLELISDLGEDNEQVNLNAMSWGNFNSELVVNNLNILSGGKASLGFKLEDYFGTKLRVIKEYVTENGRNYYQYLFLENLGIEKLNSDNFFIYDVNNSYKNEDELIATFPGFIRTYIENSDEYWSKKDEEEDIENSN